MSAWLEVAMRPEVYRRSRRVALLVGTILIGINYFDRILIADLSAGDFIKMSLTYCVPFCVSTHASVSAILAREKGINNEKV